MPRIVLDANQVVSAVLKPSGKPAKIIGLVKEGYFQLLASEEIFAEINRVLLRPKLVKLHHHSPKQIEEFLADLWKVTGITPSQIKINVIKDDPTDNKYLVCAVEGNADYIVSGDHHLKDLKEFQGIKILDPASFLRLLGL